MIAISKRGVQTALGLLWVLDGLLQLQHQMFSNAFANQVIAPATDGQPRFVSGPMNFGIHVFLTHPVLFNALFALVQLTIGALILWKPTVKVGLLLSIPWGLVVWVFGEGYGGIFSGHTLLLMGAPGAALLYVILALGVLPSREGNKKHLQKQQVAFWLVLVWMLVWVGGSIYQLLPGQNATSDVSSMVAGGTEGMPNWLAMVDSHVARVIKGFGNVSKQPASSDSSGMNMTSAQMTHMSSQSYTPTVKSDPGYWFIVLLAALQFCIGVGALFSGMWRRLAIILGVILSLIFWVVGQSLGGYYTGLATDPNTGPLLVLLGLATLGCADLDQRLARLGSRIESLTVGKPLVATDDVLHNT